ncbi:MAG: GntR family transcriptional regulator [Enterocloster asparagiformis]|nr:GntR family transcriptional regulator [Enterocloster asparagiformis]
MENSTQLHSVVYHVLLTQIQFGAFGSGENLPTIEETGARLCVSVDTARAAYLKLKEQGYITLSKNVGATVNRNYDAAEREQFIQAFFAMRKNAMIDLVNSIGPLFGNAQWTGLKNASVQTLHSIEALSGKENLPAPYAMLEHLNQKYSALGNSLLMRLVWQIFMFLHDPFFSIEENLQYFDRSADYLPEILALCRNQSWSALRAALDRSVEKLSWAVKEFYLSRITLPCPADETIFRWSSYEKSQQLCYSFAMELLVAINRGTYPARSLLPSQKQLAKQRGISLSTVRRALELLTSVGAIKSAKYVGTRVLPSDKTTENSDFSKPVLQRRLLDMVKSLQLFALSCNDVSRLTLSALDADSLGKLCDDLKARKQWRRGEILSYYALELFAKHAPYQAIRTVYSELLRQFFWGYTLRGVKGSQESINAMYDPYFDLLIDALEKMDIPRFSSCLEALIIRELGSTVQILSQLGIPGVERILIPGETEI